MRARYIAVALGIAAFAAARPAAAQDAYSRSTTAGAARPVAAYMVVTGPRTNGLPARVVLGFVPASHLSVEGTGLYVLAMVLGIVAVCGTPFLLHRSHPAPTDERA